MSENAIVPINSQIQITEKTVKEFLFSSGTKLTDQQQAMFLQLAIRNQLDPFRREIYAIPYGNNFSIVTGYQTYIKRAEQTGLLNGWNVEEIRDGATLLGAKITIHRKDWEHPFVWEVSLAEFDKGSGNWKAMKSFMIKKVSIGQGFRLAFPEVLSNLPYLAEEMEGAQPFEQPSRPALQPPQRINGNGNLISEAQKNRLYAIATGNGWSGEQAKEIIKRFGFESTRDITKDKYDEIVAALAAEPVADNV